MDDVRSLVGTGQYSVAANAKFTTVNQACLDDKEHWYCALVWCDSLPTKGDGVTFGVGMDTAAIVGFPAYDCGFRSIPRALISVGAPTAVNPASCVIFYGQIPKGLSLAVSSDIDANVNVKLWRIERRIGD